MAIGNILAIIEAIVYHQKAIGNELTTLETTINTSQAISNKRGYSVPLVAIGDKITSLLCNLSIIYFWR